MNLKRNRGVPVTYDTNRIENLTISTGSKKLHSFWTKHISAMLG